MTQTAPNTTQGSDRLWICRYIEIERDKKVIKEIKGDTGKELQVIDISIKEVAGMLSIAVCDDELLDCCNIAKSITKILEEAGTPFILRQFQNGTALLQAVENFDIIFLDILMYGHSGMQTAQILRNKAFDKILIFISASKEYVFQAYDVEAFHYLVKPVNQDKLKQVLLKAVEKLYPDPEEFVMISKERRKKKLLLKDIYYFEIKGRIISVHGVDGTFDYYGKISSLEKNLQGRGFFRCHKSYLIHLKYVEIYSRQEAVLDHGEKIPIAKRRYEAFCQEILAFMKEHGGNV